MLHSKALTEQYVNHRQNLLSKWQQVLENGSKENFQHLINIYQDIENKIKNTDRLSYATYLKKHQKNFLDKQAIDLKIFFYFMEIIEEEPFDHLPVYLKLIKYTLAKEDIDLNILIAAKFLLRDLVTLNNNKIFNSELNHVLNKCNQIIKSGKARLAQSDLKPWIKNLIELYVSISYLAQRNDAKLESECKKMIEIPLPKSVSGAEKWLYEHILSEVRHCLGLFYFQCFNVCAENKKESFLNLALEQLSHPSVHNIDVHCDIGNVYMAKSNIEKERAKRHFQIIMTHSKNETALGGAKKKLESLQNNDIKNNNKKRRENKKSKNRLKREARKLEKEALIENKKVSLTMKEITSQSIATIMFERFGLQEKVAQTISENHYEWLKRELNQSGFFYNLPVINKSRIFCYALIARAKTDIDQGLFNQDKCFTDYLNNLMTEYKFPEEVRTIILNKGDHNQFIKLHIDTYCEMQRTTQSNQTHEKKHEWLSCQATFFQGAQSSREIKKRDEQLTFKSFRHGQFSYQS